MALVSRIKEVGYLKEIDNGDGNVTVEDLSLRGRYYVVAEYFDNATPSNILLTHEFDFPMETTEAQAQAAIVALGQRVRDSRIRTNALQQYVGAVIPLG